MTTQEDALIDVLIADDDAELRHSVRLLLEMQGYRCAEAADGREAVELALRHPPRCLLLDLVMPEMDGLSVARMLRADPRTRRAHIHCVSGSSDPRAPQKAQAAGCELYLAKPVDPAVLLEAVRGPGELGTVGVVSGLTRRQAEDLLDWLQNHGCTRLEAVLAGDTFTVRCQCPPGLRLVPGERGSVRLLRG
jgi:CheY-like chemotaxis protein